MIFRQGEKFKMLQSAEVFGIFIQGVSCIFLVYGSFTTWKACIHQHILWQLLFAADTFCDSYLAQGNNKSDTLYITFSSSLH
jgi:hypothetical protein